MSNLGNNIGKAKSILSVFGEIKEFSDDIEAAGKGREAIRDIFKNLEVDDAILAFKKLGVDGEDLVEVLVECGMKTEDINEKLTTIGSSGVKGTSKLSTAFADLAAKIGISTTALGAFLGLAASIAAIAVGINLYNQILQECVENAKTARQT